jgi:hypothetical protein
VIAERGDDGAGPVPPVPMVWTSPGVVRTAAWHELRRQRCGLLSGIELHRDGSDHGQCPDERFVLGFDGAKRDTGGTGRNREQLVRPARPALTGAQGVHGGAVTVRYTFDDTTANSDPGSGKLRLDDSTNQNTATVIRADHLDAAATDWSAVLVTLDDSTSGIKGHIRLVNPVDQSKWLLFTVSAVGAESGYKNITVVERRFERHCTVRKRRCEFS